MEYGGGGTGQQLWVGKIIGLGKRKVFRWDLNVRSEGESRTGWGREWKRIGGHGWGGGDEEVRQVGGGGQVVGGL